MANSLSKSQITIGQAMTDYFRYGIPIPDHLKSEVANMTPIVGTEKPTNYPLGRNFQWNKPFYRKGGKGHDGNGNPMHGTVSTKAFGR